MNSHVFFFKYKHRCTPIHDVTVNYEIKLFGLIFCMLVFYNAFKRSYRYISMSIYNYVCLVHLQVL